MRRLLKSYTSKVANLIDKDEYVPCRNVREMRYGAKSLHLALREKPNWFSRSSYVLHGLHLKDILVNSDDGSSRTLSTILDDPTLFTDAQGIHYGCPTSGSAVEAGATVSLDIVDAAVNLNQSTQTSVGIADLKFKELKDLNGIIKELQKTQWSVDKTHWIWKCITDEPKKWELYVITGIVFTESSIPLSSEYLASGGFKLSLKKVFDAVLRCCNVKKRFLIIPSGAILAYQVRQILVVPENGRIALAPGKMSQPGESRTTILNIDIEGEITGSQQYYKESFGKLSIEKQSGLRKGVQRLLQKAADEVALISKDFTEQKDKEDVDSSTLCDESIYLVKLQEKLASIALRDDPKNTEIADLLLEMDVQELLDVHEKRWAVDGVSHFVSALLCLPPEALQLLHACSEDAAFQVATQLEQLLRCVVDDKEYSVCNVSQNLLEFFSLALVEDENSFLYSWRAAYVSAIYLCGLPEASTSAQFV